MFLLLLSCSKHDRINPYDPNSSTYLPWTGTIADTSADINDSFTVKVSGHTPDAVESYHWIFQENKTTTTVDSLTFAIADSGTYAVQFFTINKNGISSKQSTAYFTITASAPILTPIHDTIINSSSLTLTPFAADTNSTGSISSYFWYPATNSAAKKSGSPLTITVSDLTSGTIVWGAIDDDNLEALDSFSLRFNKAPIISNITLSPYWYNFNHSSGTGSIKVIITSSDPDSTLDVITNSITKLTAPYSSTSLTPSTFIIDNISPTTTVPFAATVADTVGGSSTQDTTVTTALRPGQVKVFCANRPFQMGDNSKWKDNVEQPVHSVTISHDLWCDSIEVTQGLFDSIAGSIPGYMTPPWESKYGLGPSHPAYSISWEEALLFCNARSKADGFDTVYTYDALTGSWGTDIALSNLTMTISNNGYRLPTEAEWELLCRAGTSTTFHWGDSEVESQANLYSWNSSNSEKISHPVAEKQTNANGLYDMGGNVSEWCWDFFDEDYYDISPSIDPLGPDTGTGMGHSVRGGGWHSFIPYSLRSGARESSTSSSRRIGFRTVRTAQ